MVAKSRFIPKPDFFGFRISLSKISISGWISHIPNAADELHVIPKQCFPNQHSTNTRMDNHCQVLWHETGQGVQLSSGPKVVPKFWAWSHGLKLEHETVIAVHSGSNFVLACTLQTQLRRTVQSFCLFWTQVSNFNKTKFKKLFANDKQFLRFYSTLKWKKIVPLLSAFGTCLLFKLILKLYFL